MCGLATYEHSVLALIGECDRLLIVQAGWSCQQNPVQGKVFSHFCCNLENRIIYLNISLYYQVMNEKRLFYIMYPDEHVHVLIVTMLRFITMQCELSFFFQSVHYKRLKVGTDLQPPPWPRSSPMKLKMKVENLKYLN